MKGILLAGGHGTRMGQLTQVTNKHLLAVGKYPMIFYPIRTLTTAGIYDIMVVTGREHMGDVLQTLGSGKEFGASFTFRVQDEASGIAHALLLAEAFANNDDIAVILGDNFFEDNFEKAVNDFRAGAQIFIKEVPDPERFGVAEIDQGKVLSIVEKPKFPKSNLAVTGLYFYNFEVFDFIKEQEYSPRRELEITHTNQKYMDEGELEYTIVQGYWSDMGTPQSLLAAANAAFAREGK